MSNSEKSSTSSPTKDDDDLLSQPAISYVPVPIPQQRAAAVRITQKQIDITKSCEVCEILR
jgi:hypothetical protein